jgi:hypothetical protein
MTSSAIGFPVSFLIHSASERVGSMSMIAPNSIMFTATPVGAGEAISF